MGKTDHRFAAFVHLVEDKVAKEFDDVPIARFRPSFVSCKPIECGSIGLECRLKAVGGGALWAFVDETELAQKADQASIF